MPCNMPKDAGHAPCSRCAMTCASEFAFAFITKVNIKQEINKRKIKTDAFHP